MDFTLKIYDELLSELISKSYTFQTFEAFMQHPAKKVVVLRHDVDRLPQNAVDMAKIEHAHGVRASYFYRIVREVNKPELITAVKELDHEIGYHYEDLTLAKGDKKLAIRMWEKNLAYFRTFYPVTTACMHGSPISRWDNRDIWKDYNYRDYGIIAEPYFDVNYDNMFYVTDTGRSWNSRAISVRDKVDTKYNIRVNSTQHLVELVKQGKLPDMIMINTHPHRWFNPGPGWYRELVLQNAKNVVKRLIVRFK
jgi:hypothetical protein